MQPFSTCAGDLTGGNILLTHDDEQPHGFSCKVLPWAPWFEFGVDRYRVTENDLQLVLQCPMCIGPSEGDHSVMNGWLVCRSLTLVGIRPFELPTLVLAFLERASLYCCFLSMRLGVKVLLSRCLTRVDELQSRACTSSITPHCTSSPLVLRLQVFPEGLT